MQLIHILRGQPRGAVESNGRRIAVLATIAALGTASNADAQASPRAEKPEVITVTGEATSAALERTAKAITVISTAEDVARSADLGEVLARSPGISVQRTGGLGSATTFALNGLRDDQIRFFIDGIPLELAGFPFGVVNLPVNLVDRIEVYRGVVPITFGADALGGAVNLVSRRPDSSGADASYQIGSFNTHRINATARYMDDSDRFGVELTGFYDRAENDYSILVTQGTEEFEIDRFHSGYEAQGLRLKLDAVDQPWADSASVTAFYSESDNDLQSNLTQGVPYGEVTQGASVFGATARHDIEWSGRLRTELIANASRQRRTLRDLGDCRYSWRGECLVALQQPGELFNQTIDGFLIDERLFGRVTVEWLPTGEHTLRLSATSRANFRDGDDRELGPEQRDGFAADRRALSLIGGLELESNLLDGRLQNSVFGKLYTQRARSDEDSLGGESGIERDSPIVTNTTTRGGIGDTLRFELTESLALKASYEWTTRLPSIDQLFGDGLFTIENLELDPEVSHNANLGLRVDTEIEGLGRVEGEVSGFLRDTRDLFFFRADTLRSRFENVGSARSLGVEASVAWTHPARWISLGGNTTYFDLENTSTSGDFAGFEGERVPNVPYLFANASATLWAEDFVLDNDRLQLAWNTRYVGEFFVTWESQGSASTKPTVDAQLTHTAALIYSLRVDRFETQWSVEALNLTDERVFDFFGAERPGRSLFLKATLAL